MLNTKSCTSWV